MSNCTLLQCVCHYPPKIGNLTCPVNTATPLTFSLRRGGGGGGVVAFALKLYVIILLKSLAINSFSVAKSVLVLFPTFSNAH